MTWKFLLIFQAINLAIHLLLLTLRGGFGLFGLPWGAFIYIVFAVKLIALLYFNRFPADNGAPSRVFFGVAVAEIFGIFLFGSFSIYGVLRQIFVLI